MTTKQRKDNAAVDRARAKALTTLDREYAADVASIERAINGAKFFGWELEEIKRLVFAAYGRTKLRG